MKLPKCRHLLNNPLRQKGVHYAVARCIRKGEDGFWDTYSAIAIFNRKDKADEYRKLIGDDLVRVVRLVDGFVVRSRGCRRKAEASTQEE